jgi:hypothetical protein
VTIDESASATLMATSWLHYGCIMATSWLHGVAALRSPKIVVSSPCSLTSRRRSTSLRDMSPSRINLQRQWKAGRFLVIDGDQTEQQRPHAELEVLKMYLT